MFITLFRCVAFGEARHVLRFVAGRSPTGPVHACWLIRTHEQLTTSSFLDPARRLLLRRVRIPTRLVAAALGSLSSVCGQTVYTLDIVVVLDRILASPASRPQQIDYLADARLGDS